MYQEGNKSDFYRLLEKPYHLSICFRPFVYCSLMKTYLFSPLLININQHNIATLNLPVLYYYGRIIFFFKGNIFCYKKTYWCFTKSHSIIDPIQQKKNTIFLIDQVPTIQQTQEAIPFHWLECFLF